MPNHYSISQARRRLAAVIREAESNGPVYLTRRGTHIAVIVSQAEYERLTAQQVSNEQPAQKHFDFAEAYRAFRALPEFEGIEIDPEIFNVRDKSPGRDVNFD
jgi:prevent-host-death family protein